MSEEQSVKNYLRSNELTHLDLKAALIDMDGVLYDSMKNHTAAWQRMAMELGIECTREEFYLYEGMTGAATINLLYQRAFGHGVAADEAKRLYGIKAQYFKEMGEPKLMDGAGEMLNVLKNHGLQRVLVTGSGQSSILERLNHDYPGIFDDDKRVTAHNVTHGKPHPEPYLRGMEMAQCKASQCVVVENAPLGVKAGKAAGCFTVGITTGPIPRDKMIEAGADIVYDSMPDFAAALPALLEKARNINISD